MQRNVHVWSVCARCVQYWGAGNRLALGEAALGLVGWCVVLTNCSLKAEFRQASEPTGSNIGTARVVAKVFRKLFFASVRSREARFNRYLRNRDLLSGTAQIISASTALAQVTFGQPWTWYPIPEKVGAFLRWWRMRERLRQLTHRVANDDQSESPQSQHPRSQCGRTKARPLPCTRFRSAAATSFLSSNESVDWF